MGGAVGQLLLDLSGSSEVVLYDKINQLDKLKGCYIIGQLNSRISGDIINDIKTKTPEQLLAEGWQDVTDPRKAENTSSRDYYNSDTGVKISYDKAKEGATGFEGIDHYHIYNSDYTNKKIDYYLDENGNPVGKGSNASHIVIEPEGKIKGKINGGGVE